MLKDRKAYEKKLDAQLAQWKAEIDVLKAKAKRTEVDARVNYDQVVDALQRKHDEAGNHLRKLKTAGDDAWESVKVGTDKIWSEFKAMLQGLVK